MLLNILSKVVIVSFERLKENSSSIRARRMNPFPNAHVFRPLDPDTADREIFASYGGSDSQCLASGSCLGFSGITQCPDVIVDLITAGISWRRPRTDPRWLICYEISAKPLCPGRWVTRRCDRSEIEIEVTRPLISRSCGLEISSHRRTDVVGEYSRPYDHVDNHPSVGVTRDRATEHGAVPARWGSGEPITRTDSTSHCSFSSLLAPIELQEAPRQIWYLRG